MSASKKLELEQCIDFHGAAIVNENGEEIAITEEMIEKACKQLEDSYFMSPYSKSSDSKQDSDKS